MGILVTACGGTVLLGSEGVAVKAGVEGEGGGGGTGTDLGGAAGVGGATSPLGAAGGAAGAGGQPRSGIYDDEAAAWCAQLSTHYGAGAVPEGTSKSKWSGDQRKLSAQGDVFCFLEPPDSVCVATLEASACTAPLTLLTRCMRWAYPPPEWGDAGLPGDPADEAACEEYLAMPACDGTLIRHAAVSSGPDGFYCPIHYVGE